MKPYELDDEGKYACFHAANIIYTKVLWDHTVKGHMYYGLIHDALRRLAGEETEYRTSFTRKSGDITPKFTGSKAHAIRNAMHVIMYLPWSEMPEGVDYWAEVLDGLKELVDV